jgi:hypothetical protein
MLPTLASVLILAAFFGLVAVLVCRGGSRRTYTVDEEMERGRWAEIERMEED